MASIRGDRFCRPTVSETEGVVSSAEVLVQLCKAPIVRAKSKECCSLHCYFRWVYHRLECRSVGRLRGRDLGADQTHCWRVVLLDAALL